MKTQNRGQTLVEAVVVIGMVALLVTGLIAGTTTSLKSAQSGRIRSQSVSLSQEGLEIVRSIRDESWSTFQGLSGTYCLGSDKILTPSAGDCGMNIVQAENSFSRRVIFLWQNPRMVVTSTVTYVEGESTKEVSLETYLTQWK